MNTQSLTIQLPEHLYRSAAQIAKATNRPLAEVVEDSLAHSLPPLDDIAPEEVGALARLSLLDDAALWRVADKMFLKEKQQLLTHLLNKQSADDLSTQEREQLQRLLNEYGNSMVQRSHAWLLLARRGYHVPPQTETTA